MNKIELISVVKDYNNSIFFSKLFQKCEYISKYIFGNSKYSFFIILSLFLLFFSFLKDFYFPNLINLKSFKKYIRDCKNLVKYNREKKYNNHPYITIGIPALNMEKYIERNLLSILNQSFQNFEIIIIDDGSTDETTNIVKRIQLEDKRIKLLIHDKQLGVYRSRFESILNSRSKYIILMDPDDIYLNGDLLLELYNYNLKNNLDIIEFTVFNQFEESNKIDFLTHFHNFEEAIIYQPKLSEILYYIPRTKVISPTICRNIWNKMIRKNVLLQTNDYIGKDYYNRNLITSDDMMINIIAYQFANNYSNINLSGYLS